MSKSKRNYMCGSDKILAGSQKVGDNICEVLETDSYLSHLVKEENCFVHSVFYAETCPPDL